LSHFSRAFRGFGSSFGDHGLAAWADAATRTSRPTLGEPETFVRGTLLGAAAVSGAIVIGLLLWGRWDWAVGFAAGALISLGNFQLIARAVGGVAGTQGPRAVNALWKGALFRFAISGALLVAALLLLRVSLPALVAGLLITQATMVVVWLFRSMRSLT
jgi:hypothetical protein